MPDTGVIAEQCHEPVLHDVMSGAGRSCRRAIAVSFVRDCRGEVEVKLKGVEAPDLKPEDTFPSPGHETWHLRWELG